MRTKKVFRYYCDYCKKAGCSKYHLQKHEYHCTMNPNRKCRMCELIGNEPEPILKLLSLIPDVDQFSKIVNHDDVFCGSSTFDEIVYNIPDNVQKEIIEKLKAQTEGCPACILAAFRQKGVPLFAINQFSYRDEVESFWKDVNADRNDKSRYYQD